MKTFLLLCIVWIFTAFTGIALAVPPPPHPMHHHSPHQCYTGTRYNYNRPTVYYSQPRFTVYGNSYQRRPSYCLTRNYNTANDINCERGTRLMPTHSTIFYGY